MINIYTKPSCHYCTQAKNLLNRHHQVFREIPIGEEILLEDVREQFPTAQTAPIIVIDGVYIGGYQELQLIFESNPQLLTE